MRLHGKRALVTGGSDGIGLAISEAFSREGADVLIVGRDAGKLEAARVKLAASNKGGASAKTLSADLSTNTGIDAVVAHVRRGPPLDIIVNNAGIAFLVPFETVSEEQFQQSFALNVTAVFFLTQRLLPHLVPSGASVINVSSYFADKMIPKRPSSLYSLSKGALNSLTKSLAFELGPRGIRVNAIAPGTVDTAMRRKSIENLPPAAQAELKAYVERSYPLGRIGQTSDLAGIAVYLASDEAAWTSGGIFAIDGGYTAG
ncbi:MULTISPECIES: SDR family oxidoreductase [unclassified Mesorhizobium]|uniref:SDR family NAD(P)-dependent oxidoreductase n=1 Tax=unclassified Mesorhizobium TaxID=325217 RepID=UPI000FD709ED|nr:MULTISPECIES: SDR family oxidoreductase [unclassified Mesorhizobium]TGQ41322.1 SDR family oxidoreductase [Mesorhizobium sp. M00.F.Ca.ET.216.01.1.1]TIS59257.1 MAG: SDR family oxidoreductase [Mesorhizobium sp.]TIS86356.1 MAG: SDR family oxidoreductase [Mesorhizobium sp.]